MRGFAIMLAALLAVPAQAQQGPSLDLSGYDDTVGAAEDDDLIAILCDPDHFRLSIRVADEESLDRSYPQRMVLDPEALVQALPNYAGDMQYRGALTRYLQCGPYSVRLKGDFYNANVEGELGAYPAFVTVQVFGDNRMIVPGDSRGEIAIGACERDSHRGPTCPDSWATRLDLAYDSAREKVLAREDSVSSLYLGDPDTREEKRRSYAVDHSLGQWEWKRSERQAQAKGTP